MALILVMGIPAAGKSTFCRRMQESAPDLVASTSFDEFREKNSLPNARETRKNFQCHVESELFRTRRPVWLVEDIFYLQSMRRPLLKSARRRGFQFGVVHLRIDPEEAMRRNARRRDSERQSCETIQKVHEGMEEPDHAAENSLILEHSDMVEGIHHLLRMLGIRLTCRIPEVPAIRSDPKTQFDSLKNSPESHLQKFDVITRRLVSELVRTGRFDGRKLSEARIDLMKNIGANDERAVLKEKLIEIYNARLK